MKRSSELVMNSRSTPQQRGIRQTTRFLMWVAISFVMLQSPTQTQSATLEWTGSVNSDFFEEMNWVITMGMVGPAGPGTSPPAGTIDPFMGIGDIIPHTLLMPTGAADFTIGDIGLDNLTGSLTVSGTASLSATDDGSGLGSILSLGGYGAILQVSDFAAVAANTLSAVDATLSDQSSLSLFGNLPLVSAATVHLDDDIQGGDPSPCLEFRDLDPNMSMMQGGMSSNAGSLNFSDNGGGGTTIKAMMIPEPDTSTLLLLSGSLCWLWMRRKNDPPR